MGLNVMIIQFQESKYIQFFKLSICANIHLYFVNMKNPKWFIPEDVWLHDLMHWLAAVFDIGIMNLYPVCLVSILAV